MQQLASIDARWGGEELSPQSITRFEQHDFVTAPGSGEGRLHAGDAAADHDHPLRCSRRPVPAGCPDLVLAAHVGVHRAADRSVGADAGDALVAIGARPGGILSVHALGQPLGVGDEGADDADHVGRAASQSSLGLGRTGDAASHEDRQRRGTLHSGRHVQVGAAFVGGVEDDPPRRRRSARADVEVIDCAACLEDLGQGTGIGGGEASRCPLVSGQADADDEVGSDPTSHGGDDLKKEAPSALLVPAVFVDPVVGQGGEELLDEVAVAAVQFDAVEAALGADLRRLGESIDHLGDLVGRHLVSDLARERVGDGGGGPEGAGGEGAAHVGTVVEHLAEEGGPGLVHGVDTPPVGGHVVAVEAPDLGRARQTARVDDDRFVDD